MDDSTALTASISELVAALGTDVDVSVAAGVGEESLAGSLEALITTLRSAVTSLIGVQLILVADGHSVRLSLFEPGASVGATQPIATSLHLPLRVFGPADPDSSITFYAGTAGAFVDLAADLDYAFNAVEAGVLKSNRRVVLDRHLVPVSLVSGLSGLAELSVINTAVGVLIDRGHRPEDASAELRRRAGAAGRSSYAYAADLLERLASSPPSENLAGGWSTSDV